MSRSRVHLARKTTNFHFQCLSSTTVLLCPKSGSSCLKFRRNSGRGTFVVVWHSPGGPDWFVTASVQTFVVSCRLYLRCDVSTRVDFRSSKPSLLVCDTSLPADPLVSSSCECVTPWHPCSVSLSPWRTFTGVLGRTLWGGCLDFRFRFRPRDLYSSVPTRLFF